MKQYLFHLAFENQNTNDYITEKLWNTLKSGTIPIYWGTRNIVEHLPHPRSVILIKDYLINDADDEVEDDNENDNNDNDNDSNNGNEGMDTYSKTAKAKYKRNNDFQVNITKLVDHLRKVANNRTLYYEYHSWRINTTTTTTDNDNDNDNDSDNESISRTSDIDDKNKVNNINDNMNVNNNNNDFYYNKFIQKYEFTKQHLICRICNFGYANKYGWKFNYHKQSVSELNSLEDSIEEDDEDNNDLLEKKDTETKQVVYISPQKLFSNSYNRSTCIDINKNRIVYPFQEIWSSPADEGETNGDTTGGVGYNYNYRCDISRNNHRHRTIIPTTNKDLVLERTIWDHDGVTDMDITIRKKQPITSTSTLTLDSFKSNSNLLFKFNIT